MAEMVNEDPAHKHAPDRDERCARCRALFFKARAERVNKGMLPGLEGLAAREAQREEPLSKRW